jgi:hypothetical protein
MRLRKLVLNSRQSRAPFHEFSRRCSFTPLGLALIDRNIDT